MCTGKTAYAKCGEGEECEKSACCDAKNSDSTYNKYTCVEYRGDCYLQGLGKTQSDAYLEDDAGKFYYKTKVFCAPDGNWVASS